MKICRLIFEKLQISDPLGSVRLCGWANSYIGRLTENTLEELWNGEKAQTIFKQLAQGDYSVCRQHSCPYLSSSKKEVPLIEIDEFPKFPTHLWLAYEEVCNYKCTVCWHPTSELFNLHNKQIDEMRDTIEKNLVPVLPNIKHMYANGCGELFASENILKRLADWKPVAPPEECSVTLETNGSLFDEQHWKQIENLGQYNLHVAITIMSFDEHTYQTLSGTKLPISKLENNLRFVKSLREQGIINHLQLATVVQERNFRMLPEFIRRCIEEFGADSVRLRPYTTGNQATPEMKWITDVKNANHPHHEEYLKVLEDPIFKNPKVDDWGMIDENYKWDLPYKVALQNEMTARTVENNIICKFLMDESFLKDLNNYLRTRGKSIIVHGAKAIGLFMAKNFLVSRLNVSYITTNMDIKGTFFGVPVVHPNEVPTSAFWNSVVLITDVPPSQNVLDNFRKLGYMSNFVTLQNILEKNLLS